jgi:hypothetical protein
MLLFKTGYNEIFPRINITFSVHICALGIIKIVVNYSLIRLRYADIDFIFVINFMPC